MAVRIRLKKMGRRHRPFFRMVAVDGRAARDGRVIEELGYYDPMVRDTDARAVLKGERINYWIGVGAQPSHKAGVLIRKYGENGSHLDQQKAALERLGQKTRPVTSEGKAAQQEGAPAPEAAASESSEQPQETAGQ